MICIQCYIANTYTIDIQALSQLRIYRPSPLRSSHLNIRDAQCAENKDGRKIAYHIIFCLGAREMAKTFFFLSNFCQVLQKKVQNRSYLKNEEPHKKNHLCKK